MKIIIHSRSDKCVSASPTPCAHIAYLLMLFSGAAVTGFLSIDMSLF